MGKLMKTLTFDDGITYEICDEQARTNITDLQNAVICKITKNGETCVADKTFEELYSAVQKGRSIFAEISEVFPKYQCSWLLAGFNCFAQDEYSYYFEAYVPVFTSGYEHSLFCVSMDLNNKVYIFDKTYYDNYLVNLSFNGDLTNESTITFTADKTVDEILNAYNSGAYIWFAIPEYNVKLPVLRVTSKYVHATSDFVHDSTVYKFMYNLYSDNTGTVTKIAIS